jgi:hypothetical protein
MNGRETQCNRGKLNGTVVENMTENTVVVTLKTQFRFHGLIPLSCNKYAHAGRSMLLKR